MNKAVWRWESDPFGTSIATSAPNGNPQQVTGTQTQIKANTFVVTNRFPGQTADVETGKYYNYFRDYDSSIGRYTESDPIGLRGGLNTFGYVGAKPTTKIDPDGLRQPQPEPDPKYPPFFPGLPNPIPIDLRSFCWLQCRAEAQLFCSTSVFVGIQVGRGLCGAGGSVAGPVGSAGGMLVGGYLGGSAAFLACNMIVQPMCEQRCGYGGNK